MYSCAPLTPFADDQIKTYYNAVDIFNATAGTWTTANLSVARSELAATSLPNFGVAIFAGGSYGTSYGVQLSGCGMWYIVEGYA